jgi:regulator of replication initiation timing
MKQRDDEWKFGLGQLHDPETQLRQRCARLEEENERLRAELEQLRAENKELRNAQTRWGAIR